MLAVRPAAGDPAAGAIFETAVSIGIFLCGTVGGMPSSSCIKIKACHRVKVNG